MEKIDPQCLIEGESGVFAFRRTKPWILFEFEMVRLKPNTPISRPLPLSPLQGESLQGEPLSTSVERGK